MRILSFYRQFLWPMISLLSLPIVSLPSFLSPPSSSQRLRRKAEVVGETETMETVHPDAPLVRNSIIPSRATLLSPRQEPKWHMRRSSNIPWTSIHKKKMKKNGKRERMREEGWNFEDKSIPGDEAREGFSLVTNIQWVSVTWNKKPERGRGNQPTFSETGRVRKTL